jgi:flagellar biosynthetic protein FliR
MLFSSPVFGAQNTPIQIRIFTTLAMSGALSIAIQPHIKLVAPKDLFELAALAFNEVVIGLLLGTLMQLVLIGVQMAGAFMDSQIGLNMSQEMNPISGISSTVLAQYKYFLGIVVFLGLNGHHLMIQAFVKSFTLHPHLTPETAFNAILGMVVQMSLISVQIALPVIGVGLIVDAALGLVSKAVPQMQAMMVGAPAKIGAGLAAVGLVLPAVTAGVQNGVQFAMTHYSTFFTR